MCQLLSILHTEGDAIWPHNVISHQGKAIHSIQPTLLYFRMLAPVRPVHKAKVDSELKTDYNGVDQITSLNPTCNFHLLIEWVDHNGSRLPQVFCDQSLSSAAACRCHRDGLQSAVSPVDVAMDPIHCNSLRGLNSTVNYYSVVWGVASHVYLGAVRGSETRSLSNNPVLSKLGV